MGTNTRPELSGRNKWWIAKHRYYELKHFCLQYPDWIKMLKDLDGLPSRSPGFQEHVDEGNTSDPTARYAAEREYFTRRMDLVNRAAFEACDHNFWYTFLVEAVTTNSTYEVIEARKGIMPVSRNEWYEIYRRFFWLLDKYRD